MRKFLVIDTSALPDIYEKVLYAKELLRMKEVKGINEVVRLAGISRSTFYKYKDYVFSLSESTLTKKATIHFMLKHEKGILASILQILADSKANILTINQNIPIHNTADLSITFDMKNMDIQVEEILEEISALDGVVNVEIIALE
ncbi:ACT domain-containing protein [Filifactor alocis]|uniref:ACT domain-containing protein n=1 Tax=Filifactor alocis TaxID=143361 RepID=UPI0028E8A1F6|nr:ACT domain-containing protein [Filifactor alocis]